MAQAQFPQIPDLDLPVSQRIGYGENKHFGKWTNRRRRMIWGAAILWLLLIVVIIAAAMSGNLYR